MAESKQNSTFEQDRARMLKLAAGLLGEAFVAPDTRKDQVVLPTPDITPPVTPDAVASPTPEPADGTRLEDAPVAPPNPGGSNKGNRRREKDPSSRKPKPPKKPKDAPVMTPAVAQASAPVTTGDPASAIQEPATLSTPDQLPTNPYEHIEVGQTWGIQLPDGRVMIKRIGAISEEEESKGYVSVTEEIWNADGTRASSQKGAGIDFKNLAECRAALAKDGYQLVQATTIPPMPATSEPVRATTETKESEPFLAEEGKIYFFIDKNNDTQRLTRRGDLYYLQQMNGTEIGDSYTETEVRSFAENDGWRSVAPPTPVPPKREDPPLLPNPTPSPDRPSFLSGDWSLERLDKEIPEGAEFYVRGPSGASLRYQKQGDHFLDSMNHSVSGEFLVNGLQRDGWQIEDPDIIRERWSSLVEMTEVYIGRIGDEYFFMDHRNQRQPETYTKEEIIGLIKKEGWRNFKRDELGEVVSVEADRQLEKIVIDTNRDPLNDVCVHDVWVIRNAHGIEVRRILVGDVETRRKGGTSIEYSDNRVDERDLLLPLEKFQELLKKDGFTYLGRLQSFVFYNDFPDADRPVFQRYGKEGNIMKITQHPRDRYLYIITDLANNTEDVVTKHQVIEFFNDASWKRIDPSLEKLVLPKAGETCWYQSSIGRIKVEAYAVGKIIMYRVNNLDTETVIDAPFTVESITNLAKNEKWLRLNGTPQEATQHTERSQVDTSIQGSTEVSVLEASSGILWPEADKPVFFTSTTGKWRLELAGLGFYSIVNAETGEVRGDHYDRAAIEQLAADEQWEVVTSPSLVEPEPKTESLADAKAAQVAALNHFVEVEAAQGGIWKNIQRVLRMKEQRSPEMETAWSELQQARRVVFDLQVEELKQGSLSGEMLHRAMAKLLKEQEFQTVDDLAEARFQVRRAKMGGSLGQDIKARWESIRFQGNEKKYRDGWKLLGGIGMAFLKSGGRGVRAVGEGYNKITKTRTGKIVSLATSGALAATVAFGTGGAVVGVAGALIALKRAAAGAGVTITAQELGEVGARAWRKRTANVYEKDVLRGFKDVERIDRAIGTKEEEIRAELFEEIKRNFDKQLKAAETRDIDSERWRLYRKIGAVALGGVLGGYGTVTHAFEAPTPSASGAGGVMREAARAAEEASSSSDDAALTVRAVETAASGTPAPPSAVSVATRAVSTAEAASSAPVGEVRAVAEAASTPAPSASAATVPVNPASARVGISPVAFREGAPTQTTSPSVVKLSSLLGEHQLSGKGETLWKLATESGKAQGLDAAGQERFATLVRTALNERLQTIDPALARKAGFLVDQATGGFSADRYGKNIDLSQVLAEDTLKALAEQAQYPIPGTAVADVVEGRSVSVPGERIVNIGESMAGKYDTWAPGENLQNATRLTAAAVTETTSVPSLAPPVDLKADWIKELGLNTSNVVEQIKSLPREEQVSLYRTMHRTVRDLFDTQSTSLYGNASSHFFGDHPEYAKVSVMQVLEDDKAFKAKFLHIQNSVTDPLHIEQIQEVGKFAKTVARVFGNEIAEPLKRESIEEYVLRIAFVAQRSGKPIPGLNVLK